MSQTLFIAIIVFSLLLPCTALALTLEGTSKQTTRIKKSRLTTGFHSRSLSKLVSAHKKSKEFLKPLQQNSSHRSPLTLDSLNLRIPI